jgi:hypothetical protein
MTRYFFTFLSIIYIAAIFLLADSHVVSELAPFNPYSLLHIPLYGILTVLLIFSFLPLNFKSNVTNVLNEHNASTHQRINALARILVAGFIALIVAIADEIHQSFIPTRDASITDVFLDCVGITLALGFISQLHKKRENKESTLSHLHINT